MFKIRCKRAASIIKQEGVVAYPTEGVWGIGCYPYSQKAVERVIHIKRRLWSKGFIVITTKNLLAQMNICASEERILLNNPGVTWVVHSHNLPTWVTGKHHTAAVRLSTYKPVSDLCHYANTSLISTSANMTNKPACKNMLKVYKNFYHKVDYILHSSVGSHGCSSPIRDALTGDWIRK